MKKNAFITSTGTNIGKTFLTKMLINRSIELNYKVSAIKPIISGFNKNNPLSKLGLVNFYINSKNYNFIEMSHHIILLSIVDIFANNKN